MCVGLAARVVKINGHMALVDASGAKRQVSAELLDGTNPENTVSSVKRFIGRSFSETSEEILLGNEGEQLVIRTDSFERSSFMPGVLLGVRSVRGRTGPSATPCNAGMPHRTRLPRSGHARQALKTMRARPFPHRHSEDAARDPSSESATPALTSMAPHGPTTASSTPASAGFGSSASSSCVRSPSALRGSPVRTWPTSSTRQPC